MKNDAAHQILAPSASLPFRRTCLLRVGLRAMSVAWGRPGNWSWSPCPGHLPPGPWGLVVNISPHILILLLSSLCLALHVWCFIPSATCLVLHSQCYTPGGSLPVRYSWCFIPRSTRLVYYSKCYTSVACYMPSVTNLLVLLCNVTFLP